MSLTWRKDEENIVMHVLETSGVIGSKHKLYIEKEIVFY